MGDYTEHLISVAGGDGGSMAHVLTAHGIYGMSAGTHSACRCNRDWVTHADYRAHLESELVAAGFGPVKAAAAKALEDAAELADVGEGGGTDSGECEDWSTWLRARAAAVRGEG